MRIAIEIDDRVGNFDLGHAGTPLYTSIADQTVCGKATVLSYSMIVAAAPFIVVWQSDRKLPQRRSQLPAVLQSAQRHR